MNINFEVLSQIPELLEAVVAIKNTLEKGTIEKRWLSTREVADYTPFTEHTIVTKVKTNDLIRGVHYFKKGGKLVYDRIQIDNWLMGKPPINNSSYSNTSAQDRADEILASIA